jgi:hypothetical protein
MPLRMANSPAAETGMEARSDIEFHVQSLTFDLAVCPL